MPLVQVDLIVCYDSSASPTRQIQRMGRTGRHRQGRVVYVLAQGREAQAYYTSQEQMARLQVPTQPGPCLCVRASAVGRMGQAGLPSAVTHTCVHRGNRPTIGVSAWGIWTTITAAATLAPPLCRPSCAMQLTTLTWPARAL